MPGFLIITVNFRHAQCTLEFLASASRLQGFADCHLTIVDNHSEDDSVLRLRQAISAFPNVELLASSTNRGYFGAAKWALEQYMANHSHPDWVIVCNNDIVFESPDFLTRLTANNPQTVGVVAPAVISRLTGLDANPMIATRPGRLRRLRYRLLLCNYYVAWMTQWLAPHVRRRRHHWRDQSTSRGTRNAIYAPHGSCFIFSRTFFDQGGFLDDGCFLYGEELSVAETCLRIGVPVIHDPSFGVSHNDSQTTGRMLTRIGYQFQRQGLTYALSKYFGVWP